MEPKDGGLVQMILRDFSGSSRSFSRVDFRVYRVVNADTFDLLAASGLFRCTESWPEKGREKLPFNIFHISSISSINQGLLIFCLRWYFTFYISKSAFFTTIWGYMCWFFQAPFPYANL